RSLVDALERSGREHRCRVDGGRNGARSLVVHVRTEVGWERQLLAADVNAAVLSRLGPSNASQRREDLAEGTRTALDGLARCRERERGQVDGELVAGALQRRLEIHRAVAVLPEFVTVRHVVLQ